MHLDFNLAVAFARFAPAAAYVEAEAAGRVSACLGLLRASEQRAYIVPQPDVGSGVGARRAADGALVDIDDLIQSLISRKLSVCARTVVGPIDAVRQRRSKRVGNK